MKFATHRWAFFVSALLFSTTLALAQENGQEDGAIPELPETEVEADQPDTEMPADFPSGDNFPSILESSVFASPPAIGYRADSSTTGTIINVPDIDFPGTVSVVPRDLLNDQQVLSLDDAVRDIAGAVIVGDGNFNDRIFLRGLEVRSRDFRKDGFLDPTYVPRDFQNIERIEVLKGPASVLYGSGAPSGTVNLITKKPVEDQFSDIAVTFGSWGQERLTLDTNGYASSSGNVIYRVNLATENAESFRDFDYLNRTLIAPSVTWLINDSTSLTWQGEFHRDHRRGDQGIPAFPGIPGGNPLALPDNLYVGEPANDFFWTQEFRQSLVLQKELNECWSLYVGGSSLFYEYPASLTATSAYLGGTTYLRRRSDFLNPKDQTQSAQAYLAGDVDVCGMNHKLVFGMEYIYFDSSSSFNLDAVYAPIDVANPVYLNPPAFTNPNINPFALNADFPVFRQNRVGFFLQDLVEVNDHWKVLGGVRFDTVDFDMQRYLTFNPGGGAITVPVNTDQEFNRVSPRVGVVYQPIPDVMAVYGNYSLSFNPPSPGPYLNPVLNPELGQMVEMGVKTQLLDNLSLDVAAFYITRENAPFLNDAALFLFQVGEERSQGMEMTLVGNLTDDWDIIATYAYTDTALYDAVNPLIFGQPNRNVPYNSASMWSRHNFYNDGCQTFGAALGLVFVGDRSANLASTVELPSYTRWDAGLFYRRGHLRADVYLENLFDLYYATGSVSEYSIFPGAPFNGRAQIGWIF